MIQYTILEVAKLALTRIQRRLLHQFMSKKAYEIYYTDTVGYGRFLYINRSR